MSNTGLIDPKVISIDGSAYDSTQFASNKRSVDNTFFRYLLPSIRHILSHPANRYKDVNVSNAANNVLSALMETKQVVFVKTPGAPMNKFDTSFERRARKYIKGNK